MGDRETKMKYRTPKADDQEKTHKAYELLLELIAVHQREIEPALWIGAMIGCLAENCEESDIPFVAFKKSIMEAIEHYRY
jgi:hypothetical protein